jgi:hypothetical protein
VQRSRLLQAWYGGKCWPLMAARVFDGTRRPCWFLPGLRELAASGNTHPFLTRPTAYTQHVSSLAVILGVCK